MENQMRSFKASIEWTFSTRDMIKSIYGSRSRCILIKRIPDCRFYISAKRITCPSEKLVITLTKNSHNRATINYIIVRTEPGLGECYTPSDNNWTTDKVFDVSITCLNEYSLAVTCHFTWYELSSGLYNEVRPFLLNPSLSDFTIVIGEEKLPVHKFILGVQSSVFLAMFESDMKESEENKVIIEDIRLDVMKNVLSFLYTESDEVLDDLQMALEMWIVAEKYDIGKLKNICKDKLFGLITESNVLEIFGRAEDHGLVELRGTCLEFIKDNKKKITDVPQFKTSFFEKPKLMYTLFYDLLRDEK